MPRNRIRVKSMNMNGYRLAGILLIMAIALSYTSLAPFPARAKGEDKLIIIYAPLFNPDEVARYGGNDTAALLNGTTIARVRPLPPYTDLYYELGLLNGSWNPIRAMPLSNGSVLLPNGSIVPPWAVINQTILKEAWVDTSTVFIGARGVDPEVYGRAANFEYNATGKVIPPEYFEVPINGETAWRSLNRSISIRKTNTTGTYSLRVSGLLDVEFVEGQRVLGPYLLNIPGDDPSGLAPGKYRVSFVVIKITNTTAKLFTLGTMLEDSYCSEALKGYAGDVTPHLPLGILSNIGVDGLNLSLVKVTGFYRNYVNHVLNKYSAGTIYYLHYPVIEELHIAISTLGVDENTSASLLGMAYDTLASIVSSIRDRLGDGVSAIIYSPYTFLDTPRLALTIQGKVIAPGAYTGNGVPSVLDNQNISYTVAFFGSQKIYLVEEPGVSINGSRGLGEGYIVVSNPDAEKHLSYGEIDTAAAAGLLAGQSRLLGLSRDTLTKVISNLNSQITSLNNKVRDLENKMSTLNNTIEMLRTTIGDLQSKLTENCTNQINDLKNQVDEEKKKAEEAMLYATIGAASTVIIALVFSIITVRLAKKPSAARKR